MKLTKYALFDLAQWKNGLAFKKIDFSPTGKPVIKIAELKNGITGQTQFTEADYGEDVHLTKGDMLFSWSGNPETSIDVFLYNLPDGWLNQHIFKITPKPFVDKLFLYYLLKYLKPVFKSIASNKQTTGLGHITVKDLKEVTFFLPNKKKQNEIASFLHVVDQKIDNCKMIIKNLQHQTQEIYTLIFISNIDLNWRKGHLPDLVSIKYGKAHRKLKDGIYPAFGSGGLIRRVETPLYTKESVLIPRKGSLNNIIYVNEPFWAVDTMFYTEMFQPNITKYIYHILKGKNLASMNTGSAVPSMTIDILNTIKIVIPDDKTLNDFEDIVSPMYAMMQNMSQELAKLSEIRDTLLPKLMSGEINVSDIAL